MLNYNLDPIKMYKQKKISKYPIDKSKTNTNFLLNTAPIDN